MSLKAKLIQRLQDLKDVNYSDRLKATESHVKAEGALNLIFQAGIKQTTFTAEENKTLGTLLVTAIKPIKLNIERAACVYRTRLDNSVLMKRSALQFLIDNYGQFPVGDSSLTKVLQDADIKESIEILDDLIDNLRDMTDSDEGASDRESAGSKKVPSSHTWWAQ